MAFFAGKKCLLSELAEVENATKPAITSGQEIEVDEGDAVDYTCAYRQTVRFTGGRFQASGIQKQFQVTCGPAGEWQYPVNPCQAYCRLNSTLLPTGIIPDRHVSITRVAEGETVR